MQREALERIGGGIVGRVEGADPHHQQRPEQVGEKDQDVEPDHDPDDGLRAHLIVSPSDTRNSFRTVMTKTMQAMQQDERVGGTARPVEGLEEEVIDDRGEPQCVRAAEELRSGERTCGKHEHQRAARSDARLGMGHDDVEMDMPPRRAQIARRLDLILVEALDGVVERKNHHQEIGIGKPDVEPDVGAEEIERRIDDAELPEQQPG